MALQRSSLSVKLWTASVLKKYGPVIRSTQREHQTMTFGDITASQQWLVYYYLSKWENFVYQPNVSFIVKIFF